ncbi:MAG: signal peptidase I [Acutalibacteraceae bacterium]|nr:signal peptidase I [Acutalibacteraceae bacterium]
MEEKKSFWIFDFFKVIIYSVSVIIIILTFFCRFAIVDGPSMNNTLKDQDVVLITNYHTFFGYIPALNLKQGDVVAVAPSQDTDNKFSVDNAFIKRVIAVEGQTIGFDADKGEVYIDGRVIDEPYISSKTLAGVEWDIPDVIPEDKVFVMGDNRAVSVDSRSVRIQLVDKKDIIGKAQFVVYPFDRISYIYGGAL